MKYHTIIVIAVLLLMMLFAGLNWDLFTTTSMLNLLFTQVEAPLGVLMLMIIVGLSLVFLVVVGTLETGAMLHNRRSAKELDKARKLAENKEVSRYNELRELLDSELATIDSKLNDILTRFDLMDIVAADSQDIAKSAAQEDTIKSTISKRESRHDSRTQNRG